MNEGPQAYRHGYQDGLFFAETILSLEVAKYNRVIAMVDPANVELVTLLRDGMADLVKCMTVERAI